MMQRRSFLKNITLLTAGVAVFPRAVAWPLANKATLFQNGETVMFVGDSITHNGRWHTFIENYYLTRFPQNHYRFVNRGISGDRTTDVLQRMQADVLPVKADKVVVMLGMNDSGSTRVYLEQRSTGEISQWQQQLYNDYMREMQAIVQQLKETHHPGFVFVTPTPYDQTAGLKQPAAVGKNDLLQRMADGVRSLAKAEEASLIEFFDPMMVLNRKVQNENPAATIIGGDRVHPGAAGHQLMAYLFLTQQGAPAVVSSVELNGKEPPKLVNASLNNLQRTKKGYRFTLLENALPYPVGDDAKEVHQWVDFAKDLNRQMLSVKGLPQGKYQLLIDGNIISHCSPQELKQGVNIAFNPATPQYQQAQAVYKATLDWAVKASIFRSLLQVEKMLRQDGINADDTTAVAAYHEKKNRENIYYGRIIGEYQQWGHRRQDLQAEMDTLTNEIARINKPNPHYYEIRSI